jgi:hypothetical protein
MFSSKVGVDISLTNSSQVVEESPGSCEEEFGRMRLDPDPAATVPGSKIQRHSGSDPFFRWKSWDNFLIFSTLWDDPSISLLFFPVQFPPGMVPTPQTL